MEVEYLHHGKISFTAYVEKHNWRISVLLCGQKRLSWEGKCLYYDELREGIIKSRS